MGTIDGAFEEGIHKIVVSGTSGAAVNQGADRTITLVLVRG